MVGKLKQYILKWFSLFAIFGLLAIPYRIFANENTGTDIVFVVDDSASMQENDPKKLAGEAVRRFVDLLPVEGDRAGIVTYSYDPIESQDLVTISGTDAKEVLKKFSTEKIKQNGRNTDTAAGLSAGAKILDADKSSSKKAIILITDGENDLRNRERTAAQSGAALSEFLKKGYPVYTIGVNPQTDTFKQYLTNIAQQSSGKVWFPKSSDELNGIIKEVAAELGNISLANSDIVTVNNTTFTDIKQTIPKDVLEANIQIDHEEKIAIELLDHTGKKVDLTDNTKAIVATEAKYTNVKLLSPAAGDWIVKIKSTTKNIQVKVDWIFNYDVEMKVDVPQEIKVGDDAKIKVTLSNKDKAFTAEQYKNIKGELIVEKDDDETTYPLELDGTVLVGEIPIEDNSAYQVTAKVSGGNLNKSSKPVKVQAEKPVTPKVEKSPEAKQGLPIWLKILVSVVSFCLFGGLILFLKKYIGNKRKFDSGYFLIRFLASGESIDSFRYKLPSNKSSVTLKNILSETKRDFSFGQLDSSISFSPVARGEIEVILGRKASEIELSSRKLIRNSKIELTKDNSNVLVIEYI